MTASAARRRAPTNAYVHVDDAGVPWLAGTRVKIVEVVLDKLAHGWSPEEIHVQHPGLSLAQIHAAFAWYYDHRKELHADIQRREAKAERAARASRSKLGDELRRTRP